MQISLSFREKCHRYLVAFFVGIISGAVTIAFILSVPPEVPLFTFHVQTGIFLWLAENSRMIVATFLSLLMTLGIICIVSNVQDILHMLNNQQSYKYG